MRHMTDDAAGTRLALITYFYKRLRCFISIQTALVFTAFIVSWMIAGPLSEKTVSAQTLPAQSVKQNNSIRTDKKELSRVWNESEDKSGSTLIIGISRDYPPLSFVDNSGKPSGLFVDLWKAWAKTTGHNIQFKSGTWDESMEMLRNGEVDIHSGLSFSKERAHWIDHSIQIYETITRIYHKSALVQPEDISGYKITSVGILSETYQYEKFKKAYPYITVHTYKTNRELVSALMSNEVRAILAEEQLMDLIKDQMAIKDLIGNREERIFPSTIHAGVLKGNSYLLEVINKGFDAVSKKEMADIEKRWIKDSKKQFFKPEALSFELSQAEMIWLENHPVINMGVMKAWPPLNFLDENNVPMGIGVDYIHEINKKLGNRIVIHPAPFKENFEKVKNLQLDALMDITPKKERREFFNFTRPYLTIPHVFVGRQDGSYFNSEKDLLGLTLALEEGYYNVKFFNENYPEIRVRTYPSTAEALGAVSRGEADGYAGNRAVAMYLIEQELLFNLTMQGRMNKPPVKLNIGVRKDWPILAGIIDKALADITFKEKNKIHRQWISQFNRRRLNLTAEENAWLSEHPVIKTAGIENRAPVSFFSKTGQFSGIASSYLSAVWKILKIEEQPVKNVSVTESIDQIKKEKIDVIAALHHTEKTKSVMVFSKPYLSFPIVVAMQKQYSAIKGLDDLEGKWVGIIKNSKSGEQLIRDFPYFNFVRQNSMEDALMELATGKIDALVGNLALISYGMKTLALNNLKIAAATEYLCEIRFGIRKELEPLVPILNKALDSISAEQRSSFKDKWISINFEHGLDWKTVLKWLLPSAGILVIILVAIIVWNRRLGKEITNRKAAEIKIRAMSDASHDGMIMINSRDEIIFWNKAAEKMFGYLSEEALGRKMHSLFVQEEPRRAAEKGLENFAHHGQGPVLGNVIENVAVNRYGKVFPVEIAVSSFMLNKKWYAVGSVRDISTRKAADKNERIREKRLKAYFDSSLVGVTIAKPGKGWLEVNDIFLKMIGYTRRELENIRWKDLSHPDDFKTDHSKYDQMMKGIISSYSMDKRFICKDNSILYTNYTVSCLRDENNEVEMLLSSYIDITDQKKIQIERDKAFEIISSSIQYASNIQSSILPRTEELKTTFSSYFILWEPRDQVGGDIYFLKPWGLGKIFVLGDCTGHGVPGAFMTLIVNGALDEATLETPPGEVNILIQRTHQLIQQSLGQEKKRGRSNDGMEMGVCYIAPRNRKMVFAGARFSLFIVRDEEVCEIKGDKRGVGYRGISYNAVFTNHDISLDKKETYYMTTDGFIDQIGGEKRRSFGKKRFKKLLLELEDVSMDERSDLLLNALVEYQGGETRRDDIGIAGFTII